MVLDVQQGRKVLRSYSQKKRGSRFASNTNPSENPIDLLSSQSNSGLALGATDLSSDKTKHVPEVHVGVAGINFKTAPIEIREKLAKAVTLESIQKLNREVADGFEAIVLSTCNRIEVYFSSKDPASTAPIISGLFQISEDFQEGFQSTSSSPQRSYQIYEYSDLQAVEHLLRVASGLDSLVIGEAQILTQVRGALRAAHAEHLSGPILSKLFLKAYSTGRDVREEYPTVTNGFRNSVSSSVAQLVLESVGGSSSGNLNILIVGSGKMAKLATASLDRSRLPGRTIIATRRSEVDGIRADRKIHASEIAGVLVEEDIDVIIAATASSEGYALTASTLGPFLSVLGNGKKKKKKNKLLIIDISVPRCIDPEVAKINANIELVNLDDLKTRLPSLEKEAEKSPDTAAELGSMNSLIDSRALEFASWLRENSAITPVMALLRRKAEDVRSQELEGACARLPNLSDEERRIIEKMSERIVRRLLDAPASKIKQFLRDGQGAKSEEYVSVLKDLFSLDDEDDEVEHFLQSSGESSG